MKTEQDKPNPDSKVREMWVSFFAYVREGEVAWNGAPKRVKAP